tara:strand:- start:267 stop:563 length:297 start_codon:yes stop_codon:yes gene_type:complete
MLAAFSAPVGISLTMIYQHRIVIARASKLELRHRAASYAASRTWPSGSAGASGRMVTRRLAIWSNGNGSAISSGWIANCCGRSTTAASDSVVLGDVLQ